MIRILITISFIFSLQLKAQEFDSTAWKYAKTITSADLREHLNIIASDEYEGRETGKKGQKMAMEYLIKQFVSYGIEDVNGMNYKQRFPLIEQDNKGVNLVINGKEYKYNKDFTVTPSIIKKFELNDELIFVGYGIEEANYNSYEKLDVNGKAVLIWNGMPENVETKRKWNISEKIELAKMKGASAVFIYSDKLEESLVKFEHFYNKPKISLVEQETEVQKEVPLITLTEKAAYDLLKSEKRKVKKIKKSGLKIKDAFKTSLRLSIDKPTDNYTSENVLAYIPGTDKKDEVLVITAHYDHLGKKGDIVYNGADDDGTGTVSLLEIAEAFQLAIKAGNKPRRSILIMPVSGEEKGLLGSKYYSQNPVFPLENTIANLNIDMIGRYDKAHENDSNYIYLIGSDRLSQELHDLSEKVNETYMNFGLDYTFNAEDDPNRFYSRSDHYNFAKNGVPVIFYFSGVHEDYHKATDTVEKIDFDKTARVAQLVFLTAWHLANAEERIKLNEDN
tara:strand:+ start:12548 stop:14062 length:1515 start_codon:yes stop_codon:yes gene_type:complete